MASATARKKGGSKNGVLLDIFVHFGNVNVGDETARVGVTVDRRNLSLAQADKNLCGRRLTGTMIAKPQGWEPDQPALGDMGDDIEIAATFDVKSIGVSRKKISTGLTVALSEIDVSTLAKFAKRSGQLIIEASSDIPEDEESEDDDKDDDE